MSLIFGRSKRADSMRNGEPISYKNLLFYPITMLHYELFSECKSVISIRLSTLPVKYMAMEYAQAIFTFELDNLLQKRQAIGLIHRLIQMLCISLRIELRAERLDDIVRFKNEDGKLLFDSIVVTQNGNEVSLTSSDISFHVRRIIAKQNGIELPDESENPDLIRDYEQKKSLSSKTDINVNIGDLIASVAYLSGVTETDVNNWTVAEFERRRRAIERDKLYMIYAQAESSGMVTFKKGNPVPSWCYDRVDDSLGTMSLSAIPLDSASQKQI